MIETDLEFKIKSLERKVIELKTRNGDLRVQNNELRDIFIKSKKSYPITKWMTSQKNTNPLPNDIDAIKAKIIKLKEILEKVDDDREFLEKKLKRTRSLITELNWIDKIAENRKLRKEIKEEITILRVKEAGIRIKEHGNTKQHSDLYYKTEIEKIYKKIDKVMKKLLSKTRASKKINKKMEMINKDNEEYRQLRKKLIDLSNRRDSKYLKIKDSLYQQIDNLKKERKNQKYDELYLRSL